MNVGVPCADPCASAMSSIPVVPVRLLYPAVLELIFGFCTLSELHHAQASCREWRTVLSSARYLRFTATVPAQLIFQCTHSSLGRHLAELVVPDNPADSSQPHLSNDSLLWLTEGIPQLRTLRCSVRLEMGSRVVLPPALRVLELGVRLDVKTFGPHASNAALAAIGMLTELQKLTLTLPYAHPSVDFHPLSRLPSLRAFTFSWLCDPQSFSVAQYATFRAWSTLKSLTLRHLHVEHSISALLQPPHQLQLTCLRTMQGDASLRFNDAMALQLLPALSSTLTDINLSAGVGFLLPLKLLPRLQRLTLHVMMSRSKEDEAIVLQAVQHCTELRYLSLASPALLSSASLAPLMCALPLLAELHIYAALDSLAFLSDPHSSLPHSLTSLVLDGIASSKPRREWMHLHGLGSLRSLVMRGQPRHVTMGRPRVRPRLGLPVERVPVLDDESRSLFLPPSKLFPHLTYLEA